MTRSAKAKNIDTTVVVRGALVDVADTVVANNDKAVDEVQTELIKANSTATKITVKVQTAIFANVEAVAAAGEVVAVNPENAAALVHRVVSNWALKPVQWQVAEKLTIFNLKSA